MTRGAAVSTLLLSACVLAAAPVSSDRSGARVPHITRVDAQAIDVSGVWQTVTEDIRFPFNTTQCIRSGSSLSIRDPGKGTPWTVGLTQVGSTLSGTLQMSGPWNWCAPDPVPIENGSIEGDVLSFRVASPAGSTIEFIGIVEPDGGSIAISRSPVSPGAAAPSPNNLGPFAVQADLYSHFKVERVGSPASNGCPDGSPATEPARMPRCEAADLQAPPFATGISQWVATDGVGFSPWTFDLDIGLSGVVRGSVRQNAFDPSTRTGPAPAGPLPIAGGQADARRLSFAVRSPDGARIVRFSGLRRGKDAIDFRRTVEILSQLSSSGSLHDLFAPGTPTEFTAWRTSSDAPGPAAATDVPSDVQVTLESVDDRAAVVPAASTDTSRAVTRPAFALIRYQVQPAFQGRLFVLALDAAGQPLRQFEVMATPGSHVALWDLRPTSANGDVGLTDKDIRIAETRAAVVADAVQLAADVPTEAATADLSATLSTMLGADDRFVAPGIVTIALARVDNGSLVVVASRPCVVTAGKGLHFTE